MSITKRSQSIAAVVLAVICAIALVLVLIGQHNINSAQEFNQAQASKEAALPPISSSVTKQLPSSVVMTTASSVLSTETETETETDTATTPTLTEVETPPPTIREVAPAAPESLRVVTTGADLDLTVKVDAMPYNDELAAPSCTYDPDPECPEKAYWVSDTMGVAPASTTSNSTYIVGHSWTQSPRVFDALSGYGMTHYEVDEAGAPKVTAMPSVYDPTGSSQAIATWSVPGLIDAVMTVPTANGVLTYSVSQAFVAKKSDIGYIYAFQHGAPNTLVVQTCGIDQVNRVDTEYGVVLIGTLVAAQPNS